MFSPSPGRYFRIAYVAQCLILAVLVLTGSWFVVSVYSDLDETRRRVENIEKLTDCDPEFAARVKAVLKDLEAMAFKPWIRESWRSAEDQERALRSGSSQVLYGFHNVTGPHGERRAFAVDIIDYHLDKQPSARYALSLAKVAKRHGLTTGIGWGLTESERQAVRRAIDTLDYDDVQTLGWDPCHLEPGDISLGDARSRADH